MFPCADRDALLSVPYISTLETVSPPFPKNNSVYFYITIPHNDNCELEFYVHHNDTPNGTNVSTKLTFSTDDEKRCVLHLELPPGRSLKMEGSDLTTLFHSPKAGHQGTKGVTLHVPVKQEPCFFDLVALGLRWVPLTPYAVNHYLAKLCTPAPASFHIWPTSHWHQARCQMGHDKGKKEFDDAPPYSLKRRRTSRSIMAAELFAASDALIPGCASEWDDAATGEGLVFEMRLVGGYIIRRMHVFNHFVSSLDIYPVRSYLRDGSVHRVVKMSAPGFTIEHALWLLQSLLFCNESTLYTRADDGMVSETSILAPTEQLLWLYTKGTRNTVAYTAHAHVAHLYSCPPATDNLNHRAIQMHPFHAGGYQSTMYYMPKYRTIMYAMLTSVSVTTGTSAYPLLKFFNNDVHNNVCAVGIPPSAKATQLHACQECQCLTKERNKCTTQHLFTNRQVHDAYSRDCRTLRIQTLSRTAFLQSLTREVTSLCLTCEYTGLPILVHRLLGNIACDIGQTKLYNVCKAVMHKTTAATLDNAMVPYICNVCYSNPIQIVFLTCGHACTCLSCTDKLQRCPLCRESSKKKKIHRIYL